MEKASAPWLRRYILALAITQTIRGKHTSKKQPSMLPHGKINKKGVIKFILCVPPTWKTFCKVQWVFWHCMSIHKAFVCFRHLKTKPFSTKHIHSCLCKGSLFLLSNDLTAVIYRRGLQDATFKRNYNSAMNEHPRKEKHQWHHVTKAVTF